MIQFALTDALFESRKRYKQNGDKLISFQRSIEDGSHRKLGAARLAQNAGELTEIADDQERLTAIIPKLNQTSRAFQTLSDTEKQLLNQRLANTSGELKLVLQRRNGELLAE